MAEIMMSYESYCRIERERDAARAERDALKTLCEEWKVDREVSLAAERDEIKADYHNIIRKCNTAEWLLEEARRVARDIRRAFRAGAAAGPAMRGLEDTYPWLTELDDA